MADAIDFDRAADTYDRTRALPPEAREQMTELLLGEIGSRRCLEVGVGTGRIARPLAGAGVRMVGLDLSHRMLVKLVEHVGGATPFPLVRGDATRLPFAHGSFGALLGVHVLHLIPRWWDAVAEFLRVLRPGGTVLVGLSEQDEIGGAIVEAVASHFGEPHERHRGLADVADLDAEMVAHGLQVRRLAEIPVVRRASIERIIATIEEQRWSWTWWYEADEIRDATREVRVWAAQRFGDLDEERTLQGTLTFHAYGVPGGGL